MKEDLMSREMRKFMNGETEASEDLLVSEDVLTPQEASDDMQDEGTTIRERVESAVDETQDLRPNSKAAMRQAVGKKQSSTFDLGGLDARNQRQLMKERGMGMSLDLGFGGKPNKKLSYEEQQYRQTADVEMLQLKENTKMALQERALRLRQARRTYMLGNAEARSMAEARNLVNRNMQAEITKGRYAAGLPVYEGPLDFLAGGRKKKLSWDPVKKIWEDKGETERVGGLFGAARETYGAWREAKPHIDSGVNKTVATIKKYGKPAVKKTKEAGKEFVSNTTDIFDEAKINVNSYFDPNDINRAVSDLSSNVWDKILPSKKTLQTDKFKTGTIFNEKTQKNEDIMERYPNTREFKNMWVPKQENKVSNKSSINYNPNFGLKGANISDISVTEARSNPLNPTITVTTYPKPAFTHGPAGFVDTPDTKKSGGIINNVMAMFGRDKESSPMVTDTKGIDLSKLKKK